jgi:hypothetical protein
MSDYIGFIESLQIVTTSNYSATANSHTLQFTTACTRSSSHLSIYLSIYGYTVLLLDLGSFFSSHQVFPTKMLYKVFIMHMHSTRVHLATFDYIAVIKCSEKCNFLL